MGAKGRLPTNAGEYVYCAGSNFSREGTFQRITNQRNLQRKQSTYFVIVCVCVWVFLYANRLSGWAEIKAFMMQQIPSSNCLPGFYKLSGVCHLALYAASRCLQYFAHFPLNLFNFHFILHINFFFPHCSFYRCVGCYPLKMFLPLLCQFVSASLFVSICCCKFMLSYLNAINASKGGSFPFRSCHFAAYVGEFTLVPSRGCLFIFATHVVVGCSVGSLCQSKAQHISTDILPDLFLIAVW